MSSRHVTLRGEDRVHPGPDRPRSTGSSGKAPTAYPGDATSHVLRRIAHHAGTFGPRIQENILDEPCGWRHGNSLTAVERWFAGRGRVLHWLGYRLRCRRMASPTCDLLAWLQAGCGYRGLVLATSHERLHPCARMPGDAVAHAVGVVQEGSSEGSRAVVFDPWSGATTIASAMLGALDLAHADRDYQALAFHWIGWS